MIYGVQGFFSVSTCVIKNNTRDYQLLGVKDSCGHSPVNFGLYLSLRVTEMHLQIPSSAAEMFRSNLLLRPSAIFAVIVVLALTQTEFSSAKSLGFNNGFWSTSENLSKRNSWWSKKSSDSVPNYESLIESRFTDPSEEEDDDDLSDDSPDDNYPSLDCYSDTCLPEFLSCAGDARSHKSLYRCKLSHRMCTVTCLMEGQAGDNSV